MQRGEVMCPRLRDESVTEQEIKARSPGSTDATQLCNHYTTYHSIANIARLVAVPILCLVFPLAWLQTRQSGVSLCRWGERAVGSSKLRGVQVTEDQVCPHVLYPSRGTERSAVLWQRQRLWLLQGGEWRGERNLLLFHSAPTCITHTQ